MVTDARGHEVPADSDMWGYREDMGDLSESIADVRSVADEASAAEAIAGLEASDLDPIGTVWWLANPGALYVYTGTELVQLAPQASVDALSASLARLPYAVAVGRANSGNIAGDDVAQITVTLPAGLFTSAPQVTTAPYTASARIFHAAISGTSTTNFVLLIWNDSGTTRTASANWHAIQGSGTAAADLFTAERDNVEPDALVTCPTVGCANQGIPIPIASTWTDDDDGVAHPVETVQCGVCGTDITDTMAPIEEGS